MRSRLYPLISCAALVVLAMSSGRDVAGQRGGVPPAEPAPSRVQALMISSGSYHDYLREAMIFADVVGKAVPVDWTLAIQNVHPGTTMRYPIYNRPDWAEGFDIVIHNECSADVSDPTFIRKITSAHRVGKIPAMVIHCAMHSYRAAAIDDWRELVGVTSMTHTAQHRIAIKWADNQPLVAGMPNWLTPRDELYVILKQWPNTKALATAVSPEDQREYPVAWVGDYHGARVFGTTLGHGTATWEDPVFQELLVRGFKWAVGRE